MTVQRLADRMLRERDNNCDLLRFGAANLVVFAHAFPLTYGNCEREPLYRWSDGETNFGNLGVAVFFVLSGFLITKSRERASSAAAFVAHRCLRILPALAVVVTLSVFVLGPLVSSLPAREYFARGETFAYLATFVSIQRGLPGVFEQTPVAVVVNGSLWTLQHEAYLYLAVLSLGALRMLRSGVTFGLLCSTLGAHAAILRVPALSALDPHYFWRNLLMFSAYFWAGSWLYLFRARLVLSAPLAAVAAALLLFAACGRGLQPIFALAGGYLTIYLAFAPRLPGRGLSRYGDFSYGLYLFGYPIQQLLAQALGARGSWWLNLLSAYPLIFTCAVLSWYGVEKRALALKYWFGGVVSRPLPSAS